MINNSLLQRLISKLIHCHRLEKGLDHKLNELGIPFSLIL